jgi:hypothetical protein
MSKRVILIVTVVLVLSSIGLAGETQAAEIAYCKYMNEQASAQRNLLRSPSAIAGPTQPSAGTPPQMVFGVTESLADVHKASLTMKTVGTNCDLYTAATEAQQHIFYAAVKIERDVLLHRLDLIQNATEKIERMAADQEKLVQAQNMTRPALYYLKSAKVRLDMSRTTALTGVISPYVPEMSDVPIRVLVGDKLKAERANQKTTVELAKTSGWDVKLAVGGRQQIGQFNSTADVSELGAFGEASVTYNFGRRSANSHFDKSVPAYLDWKQNQFDDVARQALILQKQLEDTVTVLQQQLKTLLADGSDIDKSLKSLEDLDTSNALAFKNQLLADQVVLGVDIGDMEFRLDRLQSYLRDNF